MSEEKLKRLVVEVSQEEHQKIRLHAVLNNQTMSRFIKQAIDETILRGNNTNNA